MLIQEIPISELNPAPYNPRKELTPADPEYRKLLKSINEFDLVEPLIWNRRTGNLVGGHQRLTILKNEKNAEKVWCSVVDVSPKREKAMNIALNKHSGIWDWLKLKTMLIEELDDGEMDMEAVGYDDAELEQVVQWEGSTDAEDPGTTPQEKLAGYLEGNIKQIVLYFKNEQYEDFVKRLQAVCEREVCQDNTEAVLRMMEFYETRRGAEEGQTVAA